MKRRQDIARAAAKLIVKLTICAAVILAIGAVVVSGSPDGEVKEAEADIYDLVPASSWQGRTFSQVMASSGLHIRAYDFNDNVMYYGLGRTERSPRQVLEQFQRAFVKAKINKRAYLEVPRSMYAQSLQGMLADGSKPDAESFGHLEAMVTGQVVPLRVGPGKIVMGGMVPAVGAQDNLTDFYEEVGTQGVGAAGFFEGFRVIEARRDPESGLTTVESTWADENFDWRKMKNPDKHAKLEQDDVRACPGCRTEIAMKSLSSGEDYSAWRFSSRARPDTVGLFYDETLAAQGWERRDAADFMGYLRDERLLGKSDDVRLQQYGRGNSWMSLVMTPERDKHGVSVMVVKSD